MYCAVVAAGNRTAQPKPNLRELQPLQRSLLSAVEGLMFCLRLFAKKAYYSLRNPTRILLGKVFSLPSPSFPSSLRRSAQQSSTPQSRLPAALADATRPGPWPHFCAVTSSFFPHFFPSHFNDYYGKVLRSTSLLCPFLCSFPSSSSSPTPSSQQIPSPFASFRPLSPLFFHSPSLFRFLLLTFSPLFLPSDNPTFFFAFFFSSAFP